MTPVVVWLSHDPPGEGHIAAISAMYPDCAIHHDAEDATDAARRIREIGAIDVVIGATATPGVDDRLDERQVRILDTLYWADIHPLLTIGPSALRRLLWVRTERLFGPAIPRDEPFGPGTVDRQYRGEGGWDFAKFLGGGTPRHPVARGPTPV